MPRVTWGLVCDAMPIQEVSTGVAGWKEAFTAQGVAVQDITLLAQYIDGDKLRLQRHEFAGSRAGG